MRPWHQIVMDRRVHVYETSEDGGSFYVRSPTPPKPVMKVIASNGMGWDHVSVSLEHRTPTWAELEHVKRIFFEDDETAMQLHVPVAKHISVHEHCLHLWRPQAVPIPLPDPIMV
jgi:hypothetical protein